MAGPFPIFLLFMVANLRSIVSAEPGRKELRSRIVDQDKITQLGLQIPSNVIDPSQVIQLSWRPRVFMYRGFLSEEECDHLISLAREKQQKPVESGSSHKADEKGVGKNSNLSVDKEDRVATKIDERISAWNFLPSEISDPLQVLRLKDEEVTQNYTYFRDEYALEDARPVIATVLLYLSNVSEGGQILFPQSEEKAFTDCLSSSNLRPTKGNAILFFNLHLNATPDRSSSYGRCPVLNGEMWLAIKFFRLRTVGKKDDRLLPNDTDCTDEDENCPQWAAIGECQRNPVFMVGSSDYYGTCRKSCNIC